MKKREKKAKAIRRPSRIAFVLMSLLMVIVLALEVFTLVIARPYYGFLNHFIAGFEETDESIAATAASKEVTQEVEEEGIILLKNENSSLPLTTSKVNVFGNGQINFVYGGTGSGAGDESANVTFLQGLANAGIEVNEDLVSFYEENVQTTADMGLVGTDYNNYELTIDTYTEDVLADAKDYSDTAVYVLSRVGGEGSDLPLDMEGYTGGDAGKSFLELQQNEIDLVNMLEENFENVIVVVNSNNAMELGFLEDEAIDAAILVGAPGSTGCNAIGEVLTGEVNPSGMTVDTFPYEVESAPSYYNFGDYDYTNATYENTSLFGGTGSADVSDTTLHYVEYQEGIYVGYRYYETAAADGYIDYDSTVQYPFGYGLSYTTFDETIADFSDDGTTITMTVTVTNTGDVSGKDVVEGYYSAPYTLGGIEKSSVVLGGFAKTDLLAPGESRDVTISWTYEDMASYDYTGIKAEGGAYVLEAGEYQILLQENSHDVIDSRTVTVDEDVIYNEENDGARSTDIVAATNQFDDVSFDAELTYVSRSDWEGTMPTERVASTKKATDAQLAVFEATKTTTVDEDVEDITYSNNGLSLSDMEGLDYDDEQWELLLEQLSVNDMKILVANGGWGTYAISSIDKPFISDTDGPNGVNDIMAGVTGAQFTGQSVIGYSWNTELAERVGSSLGAEAASMNYGGLYAPGLNIHRSPFGGRNYEYVSEDGLLTGKIVAAEITGIQSEGVYVYAKHFVANDQETNRDNGGIATWFNEQALREIYAKGFEIVVKEGNASGIMSSFNRLGMTPAAESYALLTTVLRDEWGFRGTVITDCVMACSTENINNALLAGNDLQLTILGQLQMTEEITDTAAGHQALRKACHNILYMTVNSNAMNTIASQTYGWVILMHVIFLILDALFVLYYVRRHKKMKAWKAQQAVRVEK